MTVVRQLSDTQLHLWDKNPHNLLVNVALTLHCTLIGIYLFWLLSLPPALSRFLAISLVLLLILSSIWLIKKIQFTWPLLVFFLIGLAISLSTGTIGWDARLTWLFHAKRIFYENNLYAQLDNYSNGHNDYPVIVPALAACFAQAIGYWNEVFPKSSSVFFILAALCVCTLAYVNATVIVLFLIAVIHVCGEYLFNGYMDAIVSLYCCAITLLLLLFCNVQTRSWIKERPISLGLLLTLLLSVCLLIKNEGMIAVICISFSVIFLDKNFPRKIYFLALACAFIFYLLTWKIPLINANLTSDLLESDLKNQLLNRLHDPHNLSIIFTDFLSHTSLYLSLLGLTLLIQFRLWRQFIFPVIFVTSYFCILFFVYLSTPSDLIWHLTVSSERTLMPINVTILGFCIYGLQEPSARLLTSANHLLISWSWQRNLIAGISLLSAITFIGWLILESPLKLGQTISFAKQGNGLPYLEEVGYSDRSGWAHPEQWGSWAIGYKSTLHLPIPRFPAAHTLDLVVQPMLTDTRPSQSFTIWINGRPWKSFTVSKSPEVIANIPIPSLWESRAPLTLEVKPTDPVSPAQLGLGTDTRLLSIGLISATFHK